MVNGLTAGERRDGITDCATVGLRRVQALTAVSWNRSRYIAEMIYATTTSPLTLDTVPSMENLLVLLLPQHDTAEALFLATLEEKHGLVWSRENRGTVCRSVLRSEGLSNAMEGRLCRGHSGAEPGPADEEAAQGRPQRGQQRPPLTACLLARPASAHLLPHSSFLLHTCVTWLSPTSHTQTTLTLK